MSVDQCVGSCNHYPKNRARTFQNCKKLPRASLQSNFPLPAPPTRRTLVGSVLLDSCSTISPAWNHPGMCFLPCLPYFARPHHCLSALASFATLEHIHWIPQCPSPVTCGCTSWSLLPGTTRKTAAMDVRDEASVWPCLPRPGVSSGKFSAGIYAKCRLTFLRRC